MLQVNLVPTPAASTFAHGIVEGQSTSATVRRIADMAGVYRDEAARTRMSQDAVVYRVHAHEAVAHGTRGGLFFGVTHLEPGKVGDEYFMTKGHTHETRDRAEYYWGIEGTGFLVMFDSEHAWAEKIDPGSLHYVPGNTAHRVVNTGETSLKIGACWPADAGHDYGAINSTGFPILVLAASGIPSLVRNPVYRE